MLLFHTGGYCELGTVQVNVKNVVGCLLSQNVMDPLPPNLAPKQPQQCATMVITTRVGVHPGFRVHTRPKHRCRSNYAHYHRPQALLTQKEVVKVKDFNIRKVCVIGATLAKRQQLTT